MSALKNIKFVFFDLDHTLWDYESNAAQVLHNMTSKFEILHSLSSDSLLQCFNHVNETLWNKMDQGLIEKADLTELRFKEILQQLQIDGDSVSESLNRYFVAHCCQQKKLMAGALTTLQYLHEKYPLAIISNGFCEYQNQKLESAAIKDFFECIVTSETFGMRKPNPRIFEKAMKQMNATASQSVMIGDNPLNDIMGAQNAQMHTIFYNPTGLKKSTSQWEIQHLEELVHIL